VIKKTVLKKLLELQKLREQALLPLFSKGGDIPVMHHEN